MNASLYNEYGAQALNGIGDIRDWSGYRPVSYKYIYDVVMTANQNVQAGIAIDNDSIFCVWGVYCASATGVFRAQFSDSRFYFFSSGQIFSANMSTDPANPDVYIPEIAIDAGGRININITDMSAAPNTVQIVFVGVKRYKI